MARISPLISLLQAERRLADQVAATSELREKVFELECEVAALREERQLPVRLRMGVAADLELIPRHR